MAAHGIVLILGGGPRVGLPVAKHFSKHGYQVAIARRSVVDGFSDDGIYHVKADLANLGQVPFIFQTVEDILGPPNVVIHIGSIRVKNPDNDPLAGPFEDLADARTVTFDSAYIAAQESVQRFRKLSSAIPKVFIYTGNVLNQYPLPGLLPYAVSKASSSLLIDYAATVYGPQGYRFYYADQRLPDGRPAGEEVDGEAHARMYWELVQEKGQSAWLVNFTNDGRHDFLGMNFNGQTRAELPYDRRSDNK